MNQRDHVRYDNSFFPVEMSEVVVSWGGRSLASKVVNYSAHGMRVSVPPESAPATIPCKKDEVQVRLAVEECCLSAMCVFATPENDGSLSIGLYFYNPDEQNHLQNLLFKRLNARHPVDSFVSYEWEERVGRLCDSEDPCLRKIGEEARRALQQKSRGEVRVA